ncbi:MAG: hypothetical protein ACRDRA_22085 [Pseudonocardiaceae bacterium]
MSDLLASFRELTGIKPAIEVRLHKAGVYTWEALAEVLDALGDIQGSTQRELFDQISARVSEAGGDPAPRPPNGERSEAFIVRLSLADDGQPIRCTVTNVRTRTQQPWAGWSPKGVVQFIQGQAGIAARPVARPASTATPPGSRDHVQVLDAGRAIGGSRRNIDLEVPTAGVPDLAEFTYEATLECRGYGRTGGQDWTTVAVHTGHAQPPERLSLHFEAVELAPGIQRLRVQMTARLAAPQQESDLRVG